MGLYQLQPLHGNHKEKDHMIEGEIPGTQVERVYKAGDVVETDNPLDHLFKGKFKKYTKEVPVTSLKDEATSTVQPTVAAVQEKEHEKKVVYLLGEDVTSSFDGAQEKGVMVFKDGRKYSVASVSEPNKSLTTDPISGKGALIRVANFIEEYAKAADLVSV